MVGNIKSLGWESLFFGFFFNLARLGGILLSKFTGSNSMEEERHLN